MVLTMLIMFSFSAMAIAGGDAASGEKLYNSKTYKCKVCHKLTAKKKVGPGLKDVTTRRSEAWLIKWISDPKKVWGENDAETQEMKKWKKGRAKAKKTKMKMKKNPSAQEVADIIAFLKKNDGS
jgi:cytochrome c2